MPRYQTSTHAAGGLYQHLHEGATNEITLTAGLVVGSTWGAELPGHNSFDALRSPVADKNAYYQSCLGVPVDYWKLSAEWHNPPTPDMRAYFVPQSWREPIVLETDVYAAPPAPTFKPAFQGATHVAGVIGASAGG